MKSNPTNKKSPYSQPRLRKLELKPDEVLAAGCKTPTSPPISGSQPGSCTIPAPCNSIGS